VSAALKEPDGLLAAGGDLSSARLLAAYRGGIFPWYSEGQPLLWWSPDPRCVFLPGDYRASRRLRRSQRQSHAEIRINTAFGDVIRACAGPRRSEQGTWITSAVVDAFERLHDSGWAHSIEVWDRERLTGGLYGIAIGKVFFGESMFSAMPNASKYALQFLATRLQSGDFDILDCQIVSAHLLNLGARTLPREPFITKLEMACQTPKSFENWPIDPILCSQLLLK
jgi:leucyl/phenylalanyl-tRNA--protein transferase